MPFSPRAVFPCLSAFVVDNSGSARLVLLVTKQLALFSPFPSSAQDARHHGRYGREGQRMLLLIYKPLYVTVTCPVFVWPEVSRFMDLMVYVFSTPRFDSGYMFGVSLRLLLEEFHIFYVKGIRWSSRGSHWKSGHYFNMQLL